MKTLFLAFEKTTKDLVVFCFFMNLFCLSKVGPFQFQHILAGNEESISSSILTKLLYIHAVDLSSAFSPYDTSIGGLAFKLQNAASSSVFMTLREKVG